MIAAGKGAPEKGAKHKKTFSFIRNDSLPARLGSPAGCIVAQPAGASDVEWKSSLAAQNKSKSAVKTSRTSELRLDLGAARDFMVVAIKYVTVKLTLSRATFQSNYSPIFFSDNRFINQPLTIDRMSQQKYISTKQHFFDLYISKFNHKYLQML